MDQKLKRIEAKMKLGLPVSTDERVFYIMHSDKSVDECLRMERR